MSNAKVFNQDVAESFYTDPLYINNLVFHTGYSLFYLYKNGHYEKLDARKFRSMIMRFVRDKFPKQNWTMANIKDIVQWVEHECIRQVDKEDGYYIGFKDCLYNTKTFQTEPHDINKIVTYYHNFNFDDCQSCETPVFKRFLETSLVKNDGKTTDEELIKVAQEMFGSLFIDNLKVSRAFFLYGESGQNGKSTFTNLIRLVAGKDFTSALSLSDLSKQFGLSALVGKKANVADELDDKFGSSKMFKQLVTGEPVSDRHIYGETFTLYNTAKFFYSTNVMVSFDGLDGGLRRRLMILPFYREFKNGDADKDINLFEKLKDEVPGIIYWALQGAKRLVENKYIFSKCDAVNKMLEEFEDEASSALRYVRENYNVDETGLIIIPVQKVYDKYVYWLSREGSRKPVGKKKFIRDIKGVFKNVETKVSRYKDDYDYINGDPVTCINLIDKKDIIDECSDKFDKLKF